MYKMVPRTCTLVYYDQCWFGCGRPMRGSRAQSSHRSHPSRVSLKSPQFLSVPTQFFSWCPAHAPATRQIKTRGVPGRICPRNRMCLQHELLILPMGCSEWLRQFELLRVARSYSLVAHLLMSYSFYSWVAHFYSWVARSDSLNLSYSGLLGVTPLLLICLWVAHFTHGLLIFTHELLGVTPSIWVTQGCSELLTSCSFCSWVARLLMGCSWVARSDTLNLSNTRFLEHLFGLRWLNKADFLPFGFWSLDCPTPRLPKCGLRL